MKPWLSSVMMRSVRKAARSTAVAAINANRRGGRVGHPCVLYGAVPPSDSNHLAGKGGSWPLP